MIRRALEVTYNLALEDRCHYHDPIIIVLDGKMPPNRRHVSYRYLVEVRRWLSCLYLENNVLDGPVNLHFFLHNCVPFPNMTPVQFPPLITYFQTFFEPRISSASSTIKSANQSSYRSSVSDSITIIKWLSACLFIQPH